MTISTTKEVGLSSRTASSAVVFSGQRQHNTHIGSEHHEVICASLAENGRSWVSCTWSWRSRRYSCRNCFQKVGCALDIGANVLSMHSPPACYNYFRACWILWGQGLLSCSRMHLRWRNHTQLLREGASSRTYSTIVCCVYRKQVSPVQTLLQGNFRLLSKRDHQTVRTLVRGGQAHVFQHWPAPGKLDMVFSYSKCRAS